MFSSESPITQDLVLIGGGHSHAIVLKDLGMEPVPGVRVTLISDVGLTPYSGMLPGYVAGLYTHDECHIDLRPLSRFANARLILDRAIGLDLQTNQIKLANHPPISFDWLSLDIGSTPDTSTVPGVAEFAVPVKPVSKFLSQWDALVEDIAAHPDRPVRLVLVGGGAGGVELAFSIQPRLQRLFEAFNIPTPPLEFHLIHRGKRLISERHPALSHTVQRLLAQRGVQVHLNEAVAAVEGTTANEPKRVRCQSGLEIECDRLLWVTGAAAAPWLREAGLKTDEKGFVLVDDTLQSVSHTQVFAAGDVATMINHPRPKAGVFAVRQGKPLVDNLRLVLTGDEPQPFVPQREFLILVGTGDHRAIASRGPLHGGPHSWLWRWKDRIDRAFMDKFTHLEPMRPAVADDDEPVFEVQPMRCAGCGSKVGSDILERALGRLAPSSALPTQPDIMLGLEAPDDAAVIRVPTGAVLVQTIDYFRALVDDPYVFGQICANHCLSDLFAMGATPQSALAIATLPYAAESKVEDMLVHLLSGAVKVLHQAGAVLIGGHTAEGAELALGLTCNGVADPDRLLRKNGMVAGQTLILTKAIGTGTLFAADMQLKAKSQWIEAAIDSMLQSNQDAATILQRYGATACTDVTGFGLLGHLIEMVRASQVGVELDLPAIPRLDGALETVQKALLSSIHPQNMRAASWIENLEAVAPDPRYPLLFDPQTSGGLLASVPTDRATDCLTELQRYYSQSAIIGRVVSPRTETQPVTIKL